jgi:prepilin-type N-terminal cleavage/methylation domain-containing protein
MPSAASYRRCGMTLVELMVVVAIIGILSVAVLPLLANSSESRKTREAARLLVSYITRSQNRVLGRNEWGGFWMVPVTGANYALDLFTADVPQVFQGDNLPTTVSGSSTTINGTPVFAIASGTIATSGSIGGVNVSGTLGDLVRFDGSGPWYAFVTPTLITLRGTGSYIVENANQTILNTPWPTANVAHTYELMRQPIRSGSPLTFGDGRCIDVAQSGYVSPSGYDQFVTSPLSPPSIAVLFDGTGRLRQLLVGSVRITPTGAVFLLVGRSDRAVWSPTALTPSDDSTGFNWQYADSYWIGIDPLTGVTKVAECVKGATDVVASQAYIRSQLLATGR